MPVMDGYEATQHIKNTTKGQTTAVIAITASILEEEKAKILGVGCDDFILKPFQEETLFENIKKLLKLDYIYEKKMLIFP